LIPINLSIEKRIRDRNPSGVCPDHGAYPGIEALEAKIKGAVRSHP
jgi:hypothetical protein